MGVTGYVSKTEVFDTERVEAAVRGLRSRSRSKVVTLPEAGLRAVRGSTGWIPSLPHFRAEAPSMRLLAFLATLVLLGAPAAAQPVAQDLALPSPRLAPGDPLHRVGHVVVIFEENRSFDNLFGHFPGANGLAQAGDRARQTAPDGTPYATLPPVRDTSRPGT